MEVKVLIKKIFEASKKVVTNNPEEKKQIALILAVVEICDINTLSSYLTYINSLI